MATHDTQLFIGGEWRDARAGATLAILDPATEREIGRLARAGAADLDDALAAAAAGFEVWRRTPARERAAVMRAAAALLAERTEAVAALMTAEQGKPLREARAELGQCVDMIEWCAGEAVRGYGRLVPPRAPGVDQRVLKEPLGPVAAFTPWNFPVSQMARKVAAGLAAGCSLVVKPAEETPASPAALARCFADAGLPAGVLNLVYGVPAEISAQLIASPIIRKVSFTGSTSVGGELAALAGRHVKPVTLELGGHAPAIVFADADLGRAAKVLAAAKHRNAGQVCIAPTRFLVQAPAWEPFMEAYLDATAGLRVGPGTEEGTDMGPLANDRRRDAVERMLRDAQNRGAETLHGGTRIGNEGYFLGPSVLAHVPHDAEAMSAEPFGPLTLVNRFETTEDAVAEANRLPYGLAAYAFAEDRATIATIEREVEAGMVSINHFGLGLAELPFGGVGDSGYGSEGGPEAVEAYRRTRLVTVA
jgi:succinate-semialdehyde dehydrogenase/glutarate-semialdehyde dehydrogenase